MTDMTDMAEMADARRLRRVVLWTVLGLLAAGLVVGVLFGGPALNAWREKRDKRESARRIEGICMALIQYAQNHGQQYPASRTDWEYLLDREGFIKMGVFSPPNGRRDIDAYIFVPGGEQKFDSSRVIVFENPTLWTTGGGHAGFDDGQIRWFDREEYEALVATIKNPDGTPAWRRPEEVAPAPR